MLLLAGANSSKPIKHAWNCHVSVLSVIVATDQHTCATCFPAAVDKTASQEVIDQHVCSKEAEKLLFSLFVICRWQIS